MKHTILKLAVCLTVLTGCFCTHAQNRGTILEMLPYNGWRFAIDPGDLGYQQGWYLADFNDSSWTVLRIGIWQLQGFPDYQGFAWYRIHFKMPAYRLCRRVYLYFKAVASVSWSWVNGQYAGHQFTSYGSWAKPFRLDITYAVLWGTENVLSVKVRNNGFGGGIWKPVGIEILQ